MFMVPDYLLPSLSQASGWQILPSTHGQGAVSHLLGLWCCQSPKQKARQCWASLLSCCCLSHAGVLKGITWDHLWGLIATQRSRSTILYLLVFGRSNSSFWGGIFLPCILLSLRRGRVVHTPYRRFRSLLPFFWGLGRLELQICLDNWVYKFYFQPSLSLWVKPDASLGKDVNLGVGELCLFLSALLRFLWRIKVIPWVTGNADVPPALGGKTACATKRENKLMNCRQSVQTTALCVPGGVSLRHSVFTGKIYFLYFFLLTCSRVLTGKDSYLSQWSCCPFNLNNNRGFSRHT